MDLEDVPKLIFQPIRKEADPPQYLLHPKEDCRYVIIPKALQDLAVELVTAAETRKRNRAQQTNDGDENYGVAKPVKKYKRTGKYSKKAKKDQNDELYEVEGVIDSTLWYRRLYYKIKWTGYDDEDDNWYPADLFDNAQECVDDFHKKHPNKPNRETERRARIGDEDVEDDHTGDSDGDFMD